MAEVVGSELLFLSHFVQANGLLLCSPPHQALAALPQQINPSALASIYLPSSSFTPRSQDWQLYQIASGDSDPSRIAASDSSSRLIQWTSATRWPRCELTDEQLARRNPASSSASSSAVLFCIIELALGLCTSTGDTSQPIRLGSSRTPSLLRRRPRCPRACRTSPPLSFTRLRRTLVLPVPPPPTPRSPTPRFKTPEPRATEGYESLEGLDAPRDVGRRNRMARKARLAGLDVVLADGTSSAGRNEHNGSWCTHACATRGRCWRGIISGPSELRHAFVVSETHGVRYYLHEENADVRRRVTLDGAKVRGPRRSCVSHNARTWGFRMGSPVVRHEGHRREIM
ncbi:hypothetical protein C8R44DRAFT_754908 [Mycena epipterygia]|nr:hypothetical protein C8R44DRAFT_754908 [Mycena epipterygia]